MPDSFPESVSNERWPGGLKAHLAGFGQRALAYLIDVIPLTYLVWALFYYGTGFGEVWDARWDGGSDPEARREFLRQRNMVRDSIMAVYIVYCALLESSPWCGTLGKRLMGIRVVSIEGNRLSIGHAFQRNIFKLLSAAILALGFVWVLISKSNQGWHDFLGKTLVVRAKPAHGLGPRNGGRGASGPGQGPWIG